jgi:hypothetical protein
MNNNKRNVFSTLRRRILNKSNFNKILILFMVGFVSRVLVGCFYNANFYLGFLSYVSIVHYILMFTLVLAYEFLSCFHYNIPSFIFLIIKEGIKVLHYNSLNNKLFMNSNVNEIKPYGKTILDYKGNSSYRPVKSSPLSNPPITPANISEIKPTREIKFSSKTNYNNRPVNFNDWVTSQKTSAKYLAFQERNNNIIRYKDEFKEFYTAYRESIKLSNYELESLSIQVAIENEKGNAGIYVLPEDLKPLYRKHLRKCLMQKYNL